MPNMNPKKNPMPSQEPDILPFSMAKAQRRMGSQAVTVKFVA